MTTRKTEAVEPSLERLLRHVVETMRPLEVWLFGSRAEQRARRSSDYDLLVVMPDGTPESELDPVRAWRLGWDVSVTADIIPCTRSEFEEESTKSTRCHELLRCVGESSMRPNCFRRSRREMHTLVA